MEDSKQVYYSPALNTIDDVLTELNRIIGFATERDTYLGLFAYVYYRTTSQVKEAILQKRFDDNERMERFDVAFARRYIDAFWQYQRGEPAPLCWHTSFEVRQHAHLTTLQHIFLGMNAHICYDLGITAAEIAPGQELASLEQDFHRVNQVLSELVEEMQDRIGRISPVTRFIDWLGGKRDEKLIINTIRNARYQSWEIAKELAILEGEAFERRLIEVDCEVNTLSEKIIQPPFTFSASLVKLIQRFEARQLPTLVQQLREEI